MKYLTFTIQNYKGIENPLTVNIDKKSLIPIIGVNEVGKTTILQAIFGFDYINDSFNKTVRHLDDIRNRYESAPKDPKICADVEISLAEITDALKDVVKQNESLKTDSNAYKRKLTVEYSGILKITRNLITKKYSVEGTTSKNGEFGHLLSQEIIKQLPYTLFFDDFRDSIDSRIEIKIGSEGKLDGWLAIIDRLFRTTDEEYDVLELPNKEERDRKGIISNVNRTLEKVLTAEWKNFRLEDREEALKIRLDYEKEAGKPGENGTPAGEDRHYIKFDVVEKDKEGQEYFFYIRDRSKGFYWFFNFVMKLEFNPKVIDNTDTNAIYLLDEPGSYLHAHAQVKLCKKLKSIAKDNKIIYCTHSHYLLNPEVIPINSIRVADKDPDNLRISLKTIHEFDDLITDKKSAFQPIIDALQIKPFGFDLGSQNVVIVEGIYDYYCFEMMKGKTDIAFMPGSNADSIRYLISLMIGWNVDYRALWDADPEGSERYEDAVGFFGDEEAKRFKQLPQKKILQQLFEGNDLTLIRTQLGIIGKSSFEKTIVALFYSDDREKILRKISKQTKDNFKKLIADLRIPIK